MKIKTIKNEKGLSEIHIIDDESKDNFLKIAKKIKKIKHFKFMNKIDGIHYLIWELLVENKKVQFIHHDDIGNYFTVESKDSEFALDFIKKEIQAI